MSRSAGIGSRAEGHGARLASPEGAFHSGATVRPD